MSLNIKYNANGSITVTCGDEAVDILPQRAKSRPAESQPPAQPITVTTKPASTPRKPPKIGPRVAIRLPSWVKADLDTDSDMLTSGIGLKTFMSAKTLPQACTVKIRPNEVIGVKTLIDRMQTVHSKDLTLWMAPNVKK